MGLDRKVVWQEGIFLRPQHFQQNERYTEWLVEARAGALRPYAWGIADLALDRAALKLGTVAVARARLVLPDGTPVSVEAGGGGPAPRRIPAGTADQTVYLCLPLRRPGAVDAVLDGAPAVPSGARFAARALEVGDSSGSTADAAVIEVAEPRLTLRLERESRDDHVGIGIARIRTVTPAGEVALDERYLPPALDCAADPGLAGIPKELSGLLRSRAASLAGQLHQPGAGGLSELNDFLMLQAVNRANALFAHLATLPGLHPEELYRAMVALAGELATFVGQERLAPDFPTYRHDDLAGTFRPVLDTLRRQLSAVLQQTAIPLPLQEGKYGIHVSALADRTVLKNHQLILAVAANVPPETVRSGFPLQVKIGPVENIRDLVNLQLPGIALAPLPVAPRELPFHAGFTYFELDRASELWQNLFASGGFAFHVGSQFPGLRMEFWAIKAT
ncbi:type VI secretion system baseplate subunit TssK [Azospirillum sp. ST 5-10]|uniref:type VI secretion system baseplate subunit TssK n=1 Tax=unclassified Azospirillum TaxID=2630922 RepID=UPI003F49C113